MRRAGKKKERKKERKKENITGKIEDLPFYRTGGLIICIFAQICASLVSSIGVDE